MPRRRVIVVGLLLLSFSARLHGLGAHGLRLEEARSADAATRSSPGATPSTATPTCARCALRRSPRCSACSWATPWRSPSPARRSAEPAAGSRGKRRTHTRRERNVPCDRSRTRVLRFSCSSPRLHHGRPRIRPAMRTIACRSRISRSRRERSLRPAWREGLGGWPHPGAARWRLPWCRRDRVRPLGVGAAMTVFAANTAVPLAEAV